MMVWMVEDEPKIAQVIADYLKAAGYDCRVFHSGLGVIEEVRRDPPDLLLLDRKLPGMDGIDLCRHIRRSHRTLPIIMVTARIEEQDRLDGLSTGADDYICKPFSPRELVARVTTVLRRFGHELERSPIELGATSRTATVAGQALDLTPAEFNILSTLARSPNRPYSRDQLLDVIQNEVRDVSDRAIDSHIKNLRKKLRAAAAETVQITSVYGLGYCLKLTHTEDPH